MSRWTLLCAFVGAQWFFFPAALAQSKKIERLERALFEQTKEVYEDEFEDLSDSDVDRTKRNIERTARRLNRSSARAAADHVLEEWEDGFGDADHAEECPICWATSGDVAKGTDLNPPRLDVPRFWMVNGAPYGRDEQGRLYPVHPGTGQALGPAHGWLWSTGRGWAAVAAGSGMIVPATPVP